MAKYSVYATIIGSKYIGEFEADSKEEAIEKAWESNNIHVSICHHCSKEIDDPIIDELIAERN